MKRIIKSVVIFLFIYLIFGLIQYSFALKPDEALQMLKDGNKRFLTHNLRSTCICETCDLYINREWREENNCNLTTPEQSACLIGEQHPFATIISCSDSRIVPEILFDTGMEDLFVIRVAGNTWDEVVLGSIEYGVTHAHTPVLVVMGHQHCGAITATVNAVLEKEWPEGKYIKRIIIKLLPPVLNAIKELGWYAPKEEIIDLAIKKNVKNMINLIRRNSRIVRELEEEGKLKMLGAVVYMEGNPDKNIAPGEVVFEDDPRW